MPLETLIAKTISNWNQIAGVGTRFNPPAQFPEFAKVRGREWFPFKIWISPLPVTFGDPYAILRMLKKSLRDQNRAAKLEPVKPMSP